MQLNSPLVGIKNKKSGRYFIVVEEDLPEGRIRVINLTGNAVLLPKDLFLSETVSIEPPEFKENFADEQIEGFVRFKQRQEEAAVRQIESVSKARKKTATKSRTKKSARTEGLISKTRSVGGVLDRWNSPKLTFYRHRIAPLKGKDRFAVVVQGIGTFTMSKEEFEREFNDVVMSPGYRNQGYFSYGAPPERANKFLQSS